MNNVPPLKKLHQAAVPAALKRAEHYRLLNQPSEAESICWDILEVDPDNSEARTTLILALTDQLGHGRGHDVATIRREAQKLTDTYKRVYYHGLIAERQGTACLMQDHPGCGFDAYEWLHEAMEHYEKAETMAPEGNDEAILRWNACVRKIIGDDRVRARPSEDREGFLE